MKMLMDVYDDNNDYDNDSESIYKWTHSIKID